MNRLTALAVIGFATLAARGAPVDFSHQIVPLLREHCGECHTGDKMKGGFSMNTRTDLLRGSENGAVIAPGKSAKSKFIEVLITKDDDAKMPPKGPRLAPEKVELLRAWIDGGAPWDDGFAFKKPAYEPPLKPRRPELPRASRGRTNAVDRILDAYLAQHKVWTPAPITDAEFARRLHLDLIGLLPEPAGLEKFLTDKSKDKRAKLVRDLLNNDVAYAEHWLTFWNDLLRNDYSGTGFITGGRKQISQWLYSSLAVNKPFDEFVRELIAPPTPASAGFTGGIKWRGEVSAGATVEIQFAQSVGQSFLGINLKCASCHDSFIDRWKLDEAYGLAAIYSTNKLEIHRCDKPVGRTAKAAWLFPEIGQVNAEAPRTERLKQLAALMTHPDNGRVPRTIVNRLWQRLMGRGIVHPADAMQTEPWSADLLDFLATHLADSKFDLKKTIELICTSQAYQSQAQVVAKDTDDHGFTYAGPRAKRMTAEQMVDALWQITGAAPAKGDAPVLRGKPDPARVKQIALAGSWIWNRADADQSPPGETITLRKKLTLKSAPVRAGAVISVDNAYTLYVNGAEVITGDNWLQPDAAPLDQRLRTGANNEFVIVAKNGGKETNVAGLFFEARVKFADGTEQSIGSDATWEWTTNAPNAKGRFDQPPTNWLHAVLVEKPAWNARLGNRLQTALAYAALTDIPMVRASLVKADFLQRTLGRPNRDQIVSSRPTDLSTLSAIDLNNGQALADLLGRGAQTIAKEHGASPDALAKWVYAFALSRPPTRDELSVARAALGAKPSAQGVEDLLWAVVMMPEFQLVR